MPPSSRVAVNVNLGVDAPVETVSAVLGHINAVCQFGGQVHERVVRAEALRYVLREPGPWAEEDWAYERPYFGRGYLLPPLHYAEGLVSPAIEREIAEFIRGNDLLHEGDVYVERLSYENPVEIVLVSGVLVVAVLKLVRDWPERQRLNRARASDYEDEVRSRKRLRELVVEQFASGQLPLRADQVDDLITKGAVDAFQALGSSGIELRELEPRSRNETDEDSDTV